MADEEQETENKFAIVVSNFLLNPDINDQYSLEEFQNFFPSKYRNHKDIELLHDSFVMKKKMIKEAVRKNIQEFYKVGEAEKKKMQQNQALKDVINILEKKKKQMDKELLKAKNELKVLWNNVDRCDKAVQDCHLMKDDCKKYFDMDIFKKLDNHVAV